MTTARVEKPEAKPEPVRPRLKLAVWLGEHGFYDSRVLTGIMPQVHYQFASLPQARIITIPPDAEQAAHDEYVRALEAAAKLVALMRDMPHRVNLSLVLETCETVAEAKAALDAERAKP